MVNKNKSVRSHMDSQPSLSQTSHQICASRGKRSIRSKELVQLAGNLIRLALSAVNAECLSDILFLSCSASEQLHSSLSSYAKVDRAHPHTRIYKRSSGASLYVSACSIYFLHCDADEQFNCHEGRALLLRSRHNTCPRSGRVTTRGPFLRFDDLRRR